ncbi:MAG: hypothetical protein V1708_05280, partial [Candidatus Micrarchaeota archaeon]
VYSVQQLAHLIKKPFSVAKVYSWRLARKGLAKRLLRGKISFVDDDFVVASQLVEPSYVSLSSALAFHNIVQQVPSSVECVCPRNSLKFEALGIRYHKIPASFFYGYRRHSKAGSYVFIADAEKAVLDGLYLNYFPGSFFKEVRGSLDEKKLRGFLERFKGRGRKKLEKVVLHD